MKSDSFAQFSMTRLWLLVRREVLVMTFGDYFIIFLMPFLTISIFISPTLYASNTLKDDFSLFMLFIFPTIIYISYYGTIYQGQYANTFKVLPNPFPRGMIPVRITEKFIAEFICFAILFPLAIQFFIFLSFLIFRVDFSIWFNSAVGFFAFCSPLIAFRFLRIAIVENTSLRRYHDAVPYLGEIIEFIFLMGTMFGFIIFYEDVLPLNN